MKKKSKTGKTKPTGHIPVANADKKSEEKVKEALKKIRDDLKESQGSEWSDD